jgi:hypothetical protein
MYRMKVAFVLQLKVYLRDQPECFCESIKVSGYKSSGRIDIFPRLILDHLIAKNVSKRRPVGGKSHDAYCKS